MRCPPSEPPCSIVWQTGSASWTPPRRTSGESARLCGARSDEIETLYGPAKSLEVERPERRCIEIVLDPREEAPADVNVPGRRDRAEARGEVGHAPDDCVSVVTLEADAAKRCEAHGNADSETQLVALATP